MALLFQSVLAVHIAAGTVALLVFWVPLVTKKGGRTHRRVGWVYVAAAATLAITGFFLCIQLVSGGSPLRWRAGIFLAYVSVLAGASAQLGVRALRTKERAGASRAAIDLIPPLLLVASPRRRRGRARGVRHLPVDGPLRPLRGARLRNRGGAPPVLADPSGPRARVVPRAHEWDGDVLHHDPHRVRRRERTALRHAYVRSRPMGRPDCRPRRRADNLAPVLCPALRGERRARRRPQGPVRVAHGSSGSCSTATSM